MTSIPLITALTVITVMAGTFAIGFPIALEPFSRKN